MSPKLQPEFQLDVAHQIKCRILAGDWQPGSRLPSYSELECLFPYSRITLQMAMSLLKRQGFVTSEERKGFFVHPCPPHLYHFGLVFPHSARCSLFWEALDREAPGVAREFQSTCTIYRDVADAMRNFGDRECLLANAREQCIAGLVFPIAPPEWVEIADIPTVAISCLDFPQGARVDLDIGSFSRQAVDMMRARGRYRVAIVGLGEAPILSATESALRKAGIAVPPEWRLLTGHPPAGGYAIARLLMSLPADERPNGLILVDDDVVTPFSAGLRDSGSFDPESMDVIAAANWPCLPETAVPVRFLGFDMQAVMRHSFATIRSMRLQQQYTKLLCLKAAMIDMAAAKPFSRK